MATNYMTVCELEMDLLNARLWRIGQAIKKPRKGCGCPELDAKIMKLRYGATQRLRDILFMQMYAWELASDEQYAKWNRKCPDPERLLKEFHLPVDEVCAEGQYRELLESCDQCGPERAYLDIYDPLSYWKDFSEERREEFRKEAQKCLRHFHYNGNEMKPKKATKAKAKKEKAK